MNNHEHEREREHEYESDCDYVCRHCRLACGASLAVARNRSKVHPVWTALEVCRRFAIFSSNARQAAPGASALNVPGKALGAHHASVVFMATDDLRHRCTVHEARSAHPTLVHHCRWSDADLSIAVRFHRDLAIVPIVLQNGEYSVAARYTLARARAALDTPSIHVGRTVRRILACDTCIDGFAGPLNCALRTLAGTVISRCACGRACEPSRAQRAVRIGGSRQKPFRVAPRAALCTRGLTRELRKCAWLAWL